MDEDIVHAQTLAFTTIAMFQVLDSSIADQEPNQFSAWLFTNKFLLVAIVAPVSLQALATQLPFFNVALGTTALSVWQWLPILLISSSVFITDETRKFARNRMRGGWTPSALQRNPMENGKS